MNAMPTVVQHAATQAEPKAHLAASENLDLSAQAIIGLKVLAGVAAVVALAQSFSALMIWMSPFWAHWF